MDYAAKYPALARRRQSPALFQRPNFSRVLLGHDESGQPVYIGETERLEHMATIGTTGAGKSTHFKKLLLQDVRRGRGALLIDFHGGHPGSVYAEAVEEFHRNGFFSTGRVRLVDPNIRSHITPINTLARLHNTDISVIADALVTAFERAWDDENTHEKPTIRTMLKATFMALSELNMALADAKLLYDPHDASGLRARVIAKLDNEYARDELQRLHMTALDERSKRDFRAEVIGPINRINEFVSSYALRAMFGVVDEPGKRRRTLDLLDILDRGHILLVNLQHGEAFSEADASLLGAILLRYLFLLAPRRKNREPFFVHVDEAHRVMTGGKDLPGLFAEGRKFGISVHVGLQFEAQAGPRDGLIYQALVNCTEIKCVFRVKSPEEAQRLAEHVLPLSLERPVAASVRPTVVGHQRVRLGSRASTRSEAITEGEAETVGEMHALTDMHTHSDAIGDMASVMDGAGSVDGMAESTGMVLSPPWQFGGPNAPTASPIMQYPLSQSKGQVSSSGSSRQSGTTSGTSRMSADSYGEAETHAASRASTRSTAVSRGAAETAGEHEAFEPLYQDLPASFHSKENELYFAGEMIRSLPVGRAFVSWRGKTHRITIPPPKRKS
ncbi:MAG: DUF87 domain-containing protein [Hyphomicrobiaceae bacterium]